MPLHTLFADTFYWVALLNPRDTRHAAALGYGVTLGSTRHVTTDLVLAEVLNHFSRGGPY
jgi:predicted nucleic acid-binding protein